MKTTLNNFIRKHYLLGYKGNSYNKNRKVFLEFDIRNIVELEKVVSGYNNLKIVKAYPKYAQEIKKVFVTLN